MFDAFYSDFHFGHTNIIKYCNRPYHDVKSMNQDFVRRYNEVIKPYHTVLWLGDCYFRDREGFRDALSAMNGGKILIMGNHDRNSGALAQDGFDMVITECVLQIEGVTVRCSHYPYAESSGVDGNGLRSRYLDRRPKKVKGEVLLHGHTHSPRRRNGNMIHVGVDAWDYYPALYSEVAAIVRQVFK